MVVGMVVDKLVDGEVIIFVCKLFDIVCVLFDGVQIELKFNGDCVVFNVGCSCFILVILLVLEFLIIDEIELVEKVSLFEEVFKDLMECMVFVMVNQDVWYYFNGMLFDLQEYILCCVVIDGYWLVLKEMQFESFVLVWWQIIILCKGVNELIGLFEIGDGMVEFEFGCNYLCV